MNRKEFIAGALGAVFSAGIETPETPRTPELGADKESFQVNTRLLYETTRTSLLLATGGQLEITPDVFMSLFQTGVHNLKQGENMWSADLFTPKLHDKDNLPKGNQGIEPKIKDLEMGVA